MWFASCPPCALAVASTRDASAVLNASFSPSAGYRAARWAPRAALFIHAVSLPVVRIFSPSIGDQSSTTRVNTCLSRLRCPISRSHPFLRLRLRQKRGANQSNRRWKRRLFRTVPVAGLRPGRRQ